MGKKKQKLTKAQKDKLREKKKKVKKKSKPETESIPKMSEERKQHLYDAFLKLFIHNFEEILHQTIECFTMANCHDVYFYPKPQRYEIQNKDSYDIDKSLNEMYIIPFFSQCLETYAHYEVFPLNRLIWQANYICINCNFEMMIIKEVNYIPIQQKRGVKEIPKYMFSPIGEIGNNKDFAMPPFKLLCNVIEYKLDAYLKMDAKNKPSNISIGDELFIFARNLLKDVIDIKHFNLHNLKDIEFLMRNKVINRVFGSSIIANLHGRGMLKDNSATLTMGIFESIYGMKTTACDRFVGLNKLRFIHLIESDEKREEMLKLRKHIFENNLMFPYFTKIIDMKLPKQEKRKSLTDPPTIAEVFWKQACEDVNEEYKALFRDDSSYYYELKKLIDIEANVAKQKRLLFEYYVENDLDVRIKKIIINSKWTSFIVPFDDISLKFKLKINKTAINHDCDVISHV